MTLKEINKRILSNNQYNLYVCEKCGFMTDQSDIKYCLSCELGGERIILIKKEGSLKKDFK